MRRIFCLALCGLIATAHAASAATPTAAAPAATSDCEPHNGLEFLCGPVGSEDLVPVPGTPLLLVSGLHLGKSGHVYLVDRHSHRVDVVFGGGVGGVALGREANGCPGAPRPEETSFAGLGLRRDTDGSFTLYGANDARKAIEILRFDARQRTLQWTGCVMMPAGKLPNGVAALPDSGFLATSFHDDPGPQAWQRMARGEPSGAVYEWHPGQPLRPVKGLESISGPNGVESSADGKEIYVSAWSARQLLVVSRATGAVRALPLDFMPDNIHRNPDGTLIVAGQRTTVGAVSTCGRDCPQPWVVTRIDPARGSVKTVLEGLGDTLVNYACGAISVDGMLYATARGDNRLVIARDGSAPSRK